MSQRNDNKVRPISAVTRTSSIQSSISTIPNEVEEGISISDSAISLERTRENQVTRDCSEKNETGLKILANEFQMVIFLICSCKSSLSKLS